MSMSMNVHPAPPMGLGELLATIRVISWPEKEGRPKYQSVKIGPRDQEVTFYVEGHETVPMTFCGIPVEVA